ncbi:MAG: hypothetical protein NTV59_08030 [Chloroflexi bacterium]|nr:hypothetical protein [Chloroflexota bacterium]
MSQKEQQRGYEILHDRENPNKLVFFFMLLDLWDLCLPMTKCLPMPGKRL